MLERVNDYDRTRVLLRACRGTVVYVRPSAGNYFPATATSLWTGSDPFFYVFGIWRSSETAYGNVTLFGALARNVGYGTARHRKETHV